MVNDNNPSDGRTAAQRMKDDFDTLFPRTNHKVRKDEIGGLSAVITELQKFQHGIEHKDMYGFMGVTPPNGVIFYGPSGYGKTYLAKYLAGNLKARFVDLPLNMFESKWVGEAEKTLAKYLDACRLYHDLYGEKVLIFMDEAEEALKDRRLEGWHGPRVNCLLRYMDGFEKNEGIIFGAATNYLDKVDPAFLRSGRLDYRIEIKEYDAVQMADVVRATMVRVNRSAKPHKPVQLTTQDMTDLGRLVTEYRLTPADVSESFRRAGEEKIVGIIASQEKLITQDMCYITKDDIARQLPLLQRKNNKRPIGFRI